MAYQEEYWQNFYEKAWATRAKFMDECLKNGLNSYQAVKMLEKKERLNVLSIDNATSKVEWKKLQLPDTNVLRFARIPIVRLTTRQGAELIVPFHSSFNFYDMLIDIIDETGPYDSIVELGCGYGRNLIEIFYRGGPTNVRYFGGEFTQSGAEIASKLAAATPKMNAKFFHFNHLEPSLEGLDLGKKAFVFTCHSIEQVKEIPPHWFDVVANAADFVRCAHLEPFGFQIEGANDAVSERQRGFFKTQGWNVNFAETFFNAARRNVIAIDDAIADIGLSQDPMNPGSLAFWHTNK